jgi:hypothetical protein
MQFMQKYTYNRKSPLFIDEKYIFEIVENSDHNIDPIN